MDLVLASASARRIEMFREHGFNPEIIPANVDERLPMPMEPREAVMYLSLKKALEVEARIKRSEAMILAADTVVVFNGRMIGKPLNREDAFKTLIQMRGRQHHVLTGVCVISPGIRECFCEASKVKFKDFSDAELREYVGTDEPYDKAGGYAIQGSFKKHIECFEGDIDNIIGLPWCRVKTYLR